MKKKALSLALCAAAVSVCFLVFLLNGGKSTPPIENSSSQRMEERIYSTSKSSSSQENSEAAAAAGAETYVVRTYHGHIGIFQGSDEVPAQEVMVEVSSLPKTDQLLLAEGIRVPDRQRLNQLLEDYES